MIASGLAFAVLLSAIHTLPEPTIAVSAFGAAWTIGFLAVPFPAGVGVREAVLIALVGRTTGAGAVIAASVAHRVVTIIGEFVFIVVSLAGSPKVSPRPQ